jgi:hypothetical protein
MKALLAILVAVLMLGVGSVTHGMNDCQSPTAGATVNLDFTVTKDSELCFRLGSAGATIDSVALTLALPYDGSLVSSTSGPLDIDIRASIDAAATVTLTADSTDPITNGVDSVPPGIIRAYSDDASMDLYYDGTASQTMRTFSGPQNYSDTLDHQIRKDASQIRDLASGTYTGRYSFTAVSDR